MPFRCRTLLYISARLAPPTPLSPLPQVFFLCDIVLNFFTSYFHDGELIGSYSMIARHYLRTWFLPDLIATIPFDWLIFGVTFTDPEERCALLLIPSDSL